MLQQNWLLLRQRPYGPQILKYILFSPCWPLAQRKEGLILRAQEGSQEVSYRKCVRRLKRWSLTGWHRGTGTFCHFYSYSLSHSLIPTSFPESTTLLSFIPSEPRYCTRGSENGPLIQEHSKSHLSPKYFSQQPASGKGIDPGQSLPCGKADG